MAKGENCPNCGATRMRTYDSRPHDDPNVLRRRNKRCDACGHKVTTHEMIVGEDAVGSDHVHQQAVGFMADVENAARKHFGDSRGRLFFGKRVRADEGG